MSSAIGWLRCFSLACVWNSLFLCRSGSKFTALECLEAMASGLYSELFTLVISLINRWNFILLDLLLSSWSCFSSLYLPRRWCCNLWKRRMRVKTGASKISRSPEQQIRSAWCRFRFTPLTLPLFAMNNCSLVSHRWPWKQCALSALRFKMCQYVVLQLCCKQIAQTKVAPTFFFLDKSSAVKLVLCVI